MKESPEESDSNQNQNISVLINSDAWFKAIFQNTSVGIGLMGLDRKVITANPALCEMYGLKLEELIGQTPEIVTCPEDYPQSTKDFKKLMIENANYYESERRYVRKNGEIFWAHVTMSIIHDDNHQPAYILGMVLDIDDRKRAQLALRQSEERFRVIFDNMAVGVALISLDRKVLAVNPTIEKITGYPSEEILQIDPSSLALPEDRNLDIGMFETLVNGEEDSYVMERRYRHKDGSVIWARINYSLVRDLDGKPDYLIGVMEDITEQKRASEKLQEKDAEYLLKLEKEVEQRTQTLTQINLRLEEEIVYRQQVEKSLSDKAAQEAIISERNRLARDLHDAVTQTLFSSSIIAEVLPDLWAIDPEEAVKRLEELRQLTRGALAEMRTLLVELRPNSLLKIPLPELLRQLCDSLISRARLPIQFSSEGESEVPDDVHIALYRITQEALNNIIKHAKATNIIVFLILGETIQLTIIDDGIGFDLENISEEHMGVRIMCERAESIGARCSIYSRKGEGTQISVIYQNAEKTEKEGKNGRE